MPLTTTRFKCPRFYNLSMTCHTHGWKNLAPFSWDDRKEHLRFAALAGTEPVDITVRQTGSTLIAAIASPRKLTVAARAAVRTIIVRSMSLDANTAGLLSMAEKAGAEFPPI